MGVENVKRNQTKKTSHLENSIRDSSEFVGKEPRNEAADQIHGEIALNKIKLKLEEFQANIVEEVSKKLDEMIEDVIQEMKLYELNASQFKDFARQQSDQIWSNRVTVNSTTKTSRKELPEKVFIARQSYLTTLLEVNHMRGIYNIFFVIFSVVLLNLLVHDYVVDGRINLGLNTILYGFGKFDRVAILWIQMILYTFSLYFAFSCWAYVRRVLNTGLQRFWDYTCLVTFVSCQMFFGYIIPVSGVKSNLPLVSSCVLLLEMARLMMKMHSFVRYNVPRQTGRKLKVDSTDTNTTSEGQLPLFSSYLYFLFAPTLLYRDSYPRTKRIRWTFVLKNILELVAVIFFVTFLHERYLRPYFGNFGKEKITLAQLTVSVFGICAPALMIYLCGFYSILHASQNCAAEIMKFADRMFYKDWWTAANYMAFYRDWNVIVHDWLYEYIYKDLYKTVFKGSKFASGMSVFLISAVIHEYIISFGFRFVYPALFIFFTISSFVFLRILGKNESSFGNFFLWLSLLVGNGGVISLYSMEYYARQNCPVGDSLKDYFIPVSWWCNGIVWT